MKRLILPFWFVFGFVPCLASQLESESVPPELRMHVKRMDQTSGLTFRYHAELHSPPLSRQEALRYVLHLWRREWTMNSGLVTAGRERLFFHYFKREASLYMNEHRSEYDVEYRFSPNRINQTYINRHPLYKLTVWLENESLRVETTIYKTSDATQESREILTGQRWTIFDLLQWRNVIDALDDGRATGFRLDYQNGAYILEVQESEVLYHVLLLKRMGDFLVPIQYKITTDEATKEYFYEEYKEESRLWFPQKVRHELRESELVSEPLMGKPSTTVYTLIQE